MNANFTFPRPQAPIPRPAPPPTATSSSSPTTSRESNALRASVLDAALELGLGNNGTVANWMFNNSLEEEDEEDQRSPSLAHELTPTPEESSSGRYPLTPPPSQVQPNLQSIQAKLFAGPEIGIHFDEPAGKPSFKLNMADESHFTRVPAGPPPTTSSRGKLRKKRADGYESDGGYISDASKKKKDGDKKEREKEAKNRAKEEKLQVKKEKEEERRRKKTTKGKKGDNKDGYGAGYDTDGASKSSKMPKNKSGGEVGYETDSGYVSSASAKSKKGRFFGLKSKQSKVELRQDEVPPLPTVEKEPIVLPIASMFAKTIDTAPIAPSESLNSMIGQALDSPVASTRPPHSHFLPTPAATPVYPPSSPATFTFTNRESLSSAESGSSLSPSSVSSHSHAKRRGIQFLGHDFGHGGSSGSYSTITPASQIPLPPSSVNSPVSVTQAFPPISLPNTHPSPRDYGTSESLEGFSPAQHSPSFSLNSPPSAFLPPVHHSSSNSLNSSPSAFTPQTFPTARNPSLSRGTRGVPIPAASPTTQESAPSPQPVVASPPQTVSSSPTATTQPLRLSPSTQRLRVSPTTATQPLLLSPNNGIQPSRLLSPTTPTELPRPSPTTTTQPLRPRPRFPPTDGFGPRPTLTTSPISHSPMSNLRAPSPNPSERPSLTIIPSSDYVVPSPRASPLPSPNVLAYYDIPPPSPPPSGPLPKVPSPNSFSPRSRTQERTGGGSQGTIARSRTPDGLFSQPIPSVQRGRESPFPARPILPQTSAPTPNMGPGLGATVKIPRYRELYGLALPPDQNNEAVGRREIDRARDWERERSSRRKRSDGSDGSWDASLVNADDDEEDMRDVLARFEEPQDADEIGNDFIGGKALGRSRSFEAIRKRITHAYDGGSDFEDDIVEAGRESSAEDGGDTQSRWSGSIYSRVSVLDPEKSEEARQRFIKRVEDLYGDDGREKNIPPVPKIPDAFVDGRSWNRF
ncbi:hypothetical protein H0H87_008483 [Tephrocybe sp. NHM501043]|nr:hypothetical protein H0H87_008483 [Tephrocybe sp. NHM501043]